MSLTSYRAAPPRDKPLRAFKNRTGNESGQRPGAPIDQVRRFLRRQPRARPLGASGMYQREPALERAAGHLFGFLSRSETHPDRAKLARTGALLPESPQKPKPWAELRRRRIAAVEKLGGNCDGHIRFSRGWRRLRRLRGCEPALR